jgi:hypothetical protein
MTAPNPGFLSVEQLQILAGLTPTPTRNFCWRGNGWFLGEKDVNVGGVVSIIGPFGLSLSDVTADTLPIDPTGEYPYGYAVRNGQLWMPGGMMVSREQAKAMMPGIAFSLNRPGLTPYFLLDSQTLLTALSIFTGV